MHAVVDKFASSVIKRMLVGRMPFIPCLIMCSCESAIKMFQSTINQGQI